MRLNCGDLGAWEKIKPGVCKGSIITGFVGLAIVGIYYLSLRAVQSHWDSLPGELHSLMGTIKFFFTSCGDYTLTSSSKLGNYWLQFLLLFLLCQNLKGKGKGKIGSMILKYHPLIVRHIPIQKCSVCKWMQISGSPVWGQEHLAGLWAQKKPGECLPPAGVKCPTKMLGHWHQDQ